MTQAILTDIEGTTSSISFVKRVLFPYSRRAMSNFIRDHGQEPEVRHWLNIVAAESSGQADFDILKTLWKWIDEDRKHTALKALQGMIWKKGYQRGDFTAHFYFDAVTALHKWHQIGLSLYVYSSGSTEAQKLLFSHSNVGDLTPLISGWFDTRTGGKRESASYAQIAQTIGLPPAEILFLSDVIEELDAARESGLRTILIDRSEDYPVPRTGEEILHGHQRVESFEQIPL
ncbi:MAG: acireductone synthase [Xanthomonadaceae bacterium]|jgi:enolase-phosphatase E1|nr:acireductone synthase [Xanthomonadaceae bacterium]